MAINMNKGSWFGQTEIGKEGMVNLVGKELFQEYVDSCIDIGDLFDTGDDLCRILSGLAPERGIPTSARGRLQRFYDAVKDIKEKAEKNGIFLNIGYIDNDNELTPTWLIDTDEDRDVFELRLTAYGRKVARLLGSQSAFSFNTEAIECKGI